MDIFATINTILREWISLPNYYGKSLRLCSLNLERLHHYIAGGITIEEPVAQLLGLAGFTPHHPSTYAQAWRNREALTDESKRRKNVILKEIQEETN